MENLLFQSDPLRVWKVLKPLRSRNWEWSILSDIDSQLDNDIYKNVDDPVNWGHEGTHGIASRIRMEFASPRGPRIRYIYQPAEDKEEYIHRYYPPEQRDDATRIKITGTPFYEVRGRINGFYVLHNTCCTIPEPSHLKLATIARLIPSQYRKVSYQLYLVDQQRYWNDESTYILDEVFAYQNGSLLGLQVGDMSRTEDSFHRGLEMNLYGLYLMKEAQDPAIAQVTLAATKRNLEIYEKVAKSNPQVSKNYEDLQTVMSEMNVSADLN